LTIGEATLAIAGLLGVAVNAAMFHEARALGRWFDRAGGIETARLARLHAWRAALRVVASLGALVVGGLAAATPGRFAGQGVGFGIAIVSGVLGFVAIVAASMLDLAHRLDVRRGLVRELVAENAE
jgi:hypothetical protein